MQIFWKCGKQRKRTNRRRLRSEILESRHLMAANMFHNEAMPEDVTQDGRVTALDAITIINNISQQALDGSSERGAGRMTDVNNDGKESPLDALMVINRISLGTLYRSDNSGASYDTAVDDTTMDDTAAEQAVVDSAVDVGSATDAAAAQDDVVLHWNDLFGELLAEDEFNQNPGYASRAMAMLNLAIFDGVNLAEGNAEDAFYDYDVKLRGDLQSEVVASQAAYTILSELYAGQQDVIDLARAQILGSGSDSESVNLGTEVGEAIIAFRAEDGFDAEVTYTYGTEAGDFQVDPLNPNVPVWGPAWGDVDTFAISSAEDYQPGTTPDLDSVEYAESYNEVLELGSVDSETRTADETEAGIFWAYDREGLGTPMALFADVLESIAVQEGNTFAENAALFAQASVAMADAGVVAWQSKFDEQFWRPVTAIQAGETDGNPLTEADADWTALGAPDGGDDIIGFTPQFPTYVSGHATFGGALFGAIREFYGTDDIAFDLVSEELEILMENPELEAAYGLDLDDASRSFDSLTEAMQENGRSRVYLGIHFDFDDTVGQEVGQNVATAVAAEFSVPDIDSGDSDLLRDNDGYDHRHDLMTDNSRSSREKRTDAAVDSMMNDRHSDFIRDADLDRIARDQLARSRSQGHRGLRT